MFHLAFTDGGSFHDYRTFAEHNDMDRYHRFVEVLLDEGVRVIGRGMWYLSTAHTDEDVEFTLGAAKSALQEMDR